MNAELFSPRFLCAPLITRDSFTTLCVITTAARTNFGQAVETLPGAISCVLSVLSVKLAFNCCCPSFEKVAEFVSRRGSLQSNEVSCSTVDLFVRVGIALFDCKTAFRCARRFGEGFFLLEIDAGPYWRVSLSYSICFVRVYSVYSPKYRPQSRERVYCVPDSD